MGAVEKQTFNYVFGYDRETGNGSVILSPDKKTRLAVDHSGPVTLARCREILKKGEKLSGRTFSKIKIVHQVFTKTPGNECGDFPEKCLYDKVFTYNLDENEMMIFEKGEPVYCNSDGVISRDQVALYDNM